jgi:hypothetical protein
MKTPHDGWDADERDTLRGIAAELDVIRTRHADDPPMDLLRAGHHDALPPELQADATDYLSNSAWSRALVEGLDDAEIALQPEDQDRLLARINKDAGAEERPAGWRWLRPALAMSAIAVLCLAVWTSRDMFRPPAAPSSTPPREVTVTPSPPPVRQVQLPIDKPEITLSAAALTWRGAAPDNPLLAELKPAVDAFREGDYARADREFGALEPRYPSAIEVFYYGGVSRLLHGDAARAIDALQKAAPLADETFAPEVEWYRALAEQRAGHAADARTRFDALCRGTSHRAGRACEVLKQIDGR